jgi:hypothetical protein
MLITNHASFPPILAQYHEVRGISAGGCVSHGHRAPPDELAHTHAVPSERYYGWLCFNSIAFLLDEQLIRHELAHLLATNSFGHDDLWRAKVLELGGFLHGYTFTLGPMHYSVPSFEKNAQGDDTYGGWKKKLAEFNRLKR